MFDSLNEALIDCVKAAGGSKKVGPKLWPEKPQDAATRLLLDCLNEDRPAKLSPEQVMFIMRMAREVNFHDGMNYFAETLGYGTPVPVNPADELQKLMVSFNSAMPEMSALVARIERAADRVRAVQDKTL